MKVGVARGPRRLATAQDARPPQCFIKLSVPAATNGPFLAGFLPHLVSQGPSCPLTPASAQMYLHQTWYEMILFKEWVPESKGAYVGACFGFAFLAVLTQVWQLWAPAF